MIGFVFVCCLDEASCPGCYWWLGDAWSCITVVSFVWVLTIWYPLGLVLWYSRILDSVPPLQRLRALSRVLHRPIYSFLLVRYSCLLSFGVLHALLCLKVYSWCICGERCTPHTPTPPPSCSPSCSNYSSLNFYQYYPSGFLFSYKTCVLLSEASAITWNGPHMLSPTQT